MINKTEVFYRDRQTGRLVKEKIFAENTLRWFYENPFGFQIFNFLLNNQIANSIYGKIYDSASSRNKIQKFVSQYGIDLEEVELPLSDYLTFNAFFSRRLKAEARPFCSNPEFFSSPSDGKVLVYPNLEEKNRIPVKGSLITLSSLLGSEAIAEPYQNGSALIIRLAPYDYHRFHFPDDGEASYPRNIKGKYHSVNPIALAKVPNLFCQNKRTITEFNSQNFGKISYVEIGALTVGSIIQTYTPGQVKKGQEKGYFQYGGSTLVLLFEPDAIAFDNDLIEDSKKNLEVHVLTGNCVGQKLR